MKLFQITLLTLLTVLSSSCQKSKQAVIIDNPGHHAVELMPVSDKAFSDIPLDVLTAQMQSKLDEAIMFHDTIGIMNACNNLGICYWRNNNLNLAAKYCTMGIITWEQYSDSLSVPARRAIIRNTNGLGKLYLALLDYDNAKREFRKSLSYESSGDSLGRIVNYNDLIYVFIKERQRDSARFYIDESRKFAESSGDPVLMAIYYEREGRFTQISAKFKESEAYYRKAYEYFKKSGHKWHYLESASLLADAMMKNKYWKGAEKVLNEMLIMARELKSDEYQTIGHKLMCRNAKHQGNTLEALRHSELRNSYSERLNRTQLLGSISDVRKEYQKIKDGNAIDDLRYWKDRSESKRRLQLIFSLLFFLIATVTWAFYNSVVSARLKKMNKLARESEEMKRSFIQSMCHEIRTPLNHISGFSQAIAQGYDSMTSEERKEYGEIIERSTNNLTGLLNQILEVSYLDSSSEEFPMDSVDLNSLGREVLDSFAWKHRSKGLKIDFITTLPAELRVKSNSKYLARQLENLLDNAAKFTEKGSVTLTFSESKSGSIILSVADTGIGIDPSLHEKVFEKFYKINSFYPGSGLGLYLCRIIAKKLGNRVFINPEYTGGTEVLITF